MKQGSRLVLSGKNDMHTFLRTTALVLAVACPWVGDTMAQCQSDLNGNLLIDNDDLMILLADYGSTCEFAAWDDPVISEIHYNPSTQQGNDNQFEFVELMNPHPFAINLSGWVLADGIDASFPHGTMLPPGGFMLTVADTAVYRTMLGPFVSMVPWEATSSLHNKGKPFGCFVQMAHSETLSPTATPMAGPVKPMAWGLRWNGKEAIGTTANPKHGLVRTPWADHLEATTAHGPTDSMRSDLLNSSLTHTVKGSP